MTATPLTQRPLDFLYFSFFLTHVPASLLIDFQALYPPSYVPSLLLNLQRWYVGFSGDPLIGGMAQGKGNDELVWFSTFVWLELLFQFPVFLLGMKGLWKGSKSIYPLLLAYSASTATTTLPCVFFILKSAYQISSAQQAMLLSSYIPFFLVPFGMALDMACRLYSIVTSAESVAVKEKTS
ncbi:hypothetical protein K435DRAFT_684042 [Dendrothele bispora CBS 962.96]|uniref:Efficient mitochondria targeting-associated protein 19 n=1 Tax=Dendrothele bispora (strain CBS 962.96) TaxID=1314807 RepID=A0A4S8LBH9_DENBC|nr:hypothetical protein K435DRAFT_684042 [Dendrothele bispora CBS 962.96]